MNTGGVSALNPNYGKVKQLCAQLGYGSKDKDDPRYFDKLSKKVIAYRKSFITDRMEQVTNFPLNYDHEQVQRCAEHFLEDNSNLFCQDQEGLIRPTFLSAHDIQVRDNLARLMCMQEWHTQKHLHGPLEKETEEQLLSDHEDSDTLCDPTDGLWEANEDDLAVWDVPESPFVPVSSPVSMDEVVHQSAEELTKKVRTNIAKHLDLVYPLDGSRSNLSAEWVCNVSKNKRCPKNMTPCVFRYLHSHSLYEQDADGIKNFMDDLLKSLDIHSDEFNVYLYERCKKLVVNSAKKWKKLGLLFKEEGVLRRTEEFETAWNQRRAIWETRTHTASELDDNTNKQASFGAERHEVQKKKRPQGTSHERSVTSPMRAESTMVDLEDQLIMASADAGSEDGTRCRKRAKMASASDADGFYYRPIQTIDLTTTKYTAESWIENPVYCLNDADDTPCIDSFRAPIANMTPSTPHDDAVTPVTVNTTGPNHLNDSDFRLSQSASLPRAEGPPSQPSELPQMMSYDGLPPHFPPQVTKDNNNSPVDPSHHLDTQDNQEPSIRPRDTSDPNSLPERTTFTNNALEPQPTQPGAQPQVQGQAQSQSRMQAQPQVQPEGQSEGLSQALPQAPPQIQTEAQPQLQLESQKLFFVLCMHMGAPDLENKIPWEVVREWNISEFFGQLSTRHPLVYQSAPNVTLDPNWLRDFEVILCRDNTESTWDTHKLTINQLFKIYKKSKPDGPPGQILVSAPNMTFSAW